MLLLLTMGTWTSCDVHELPEPPEREALVLKMTYDTELTRWLHRYENSVVKEDTVGPTTQSIRRYGAMRHIVRTYPKNAKQRVTQNHVQEFVFIRDISEGYDCEVTLDILPGDYTVMVWSDLMENSGATPFHDATEFAEISLHGTHRGNTDYRDAFRGTGEVSLVTDIIQEAPDTLDILMQRPLARFEFVTNDLQEFIDKEIEYLTKQAETRGEELPTRVELDNYKAVIYYSGYMPDTYNLYTDKPIDSSTGVKFESKLDALNDKEASLGFDYVFVNGKESGVSVQVGVYDKDGRQLSLTEPVNVPLRRNHNTVLMGSFMIQRASGGITINSSFNGNHNIEIQ